MLRGRDLIMIFDRFVGPKKGSSVAQDARVQVRTPDGRHYDVMSVNLVENKIFGVILLSSCHNLVSGFI